MADLEYWNTQDDIARLNAVQYLREQFYGKDQHVERIIKIRKLGQSPEEARDL